MAKNKGLHSGEHAPVSGQYQNTKTGLEITAVKGNPLPPGPKGSRQQRAIYPEYPSPRSNSASSALRTRHFELNWTHGFATGSWRGSGQGFWTSTGGS